MPEAVDPDRATESAAAAQPAAPQTPEGQPASPATDAAVATDELGGPKGPEPTRYGDWERKGRCIDF